MILSENIRSVVPYVPGEQPTETDIIKLNTNENPYPPSPEVTKLLHNRDFSLRKYPSPEASELTNAIAEYHHVKKEQVFVGVGSDDVIAMCFLSFFNSGKPILFPKISYGFYKVWAELYKIPYRQIPLDEDFKIIPKDYFIENGGIVFPNPNAPTGLFLPLEQVESIVAASPDTLVIVDEAYIDFSGGSALPLVEKYDNLIVTRTFSKSRSMAGMRIGYCIGSENLISTLNSVKFSYNSYTMSEIAIKTGVASLSDDEYFHSTLEKIISTREKTKAELSKLGFDFPDSRTNFIFAKHRSVSGKQIFEELKKKKIYVRRFDADGISDYLRITIGTDEEMNELLVQLKIILG